MKLQLIIENETAFSIPSKKVIEGWITSVLKKKKIAGEIEVGLKIVTKEEIKRLNKKYRKIDQPTDVLSFPLQEKSQGKQGSLLLGDIVCCYEVAFQNAQKFGKTLEQELKYLIIHSTLHLLGYHH